MTRTYLGLDIGTSSVKALLVDADQKVVAEASPSLTVSRPHPLWSEQDPDDWVRGRRGRRRGDPRRGAGGVRETRRDRALRADARRDAARRGRQAAPPGDPVERRALVRRMRGTQAPRSGCREDHRQPGDAGLHRAKDAVGRGPRAGDRQGDEARAAPQGLRAPAPQRRGRFGNVRRVRNVVARRRQSAAGTSACSRRPASRSPRCRVSSRAPRSRLIFRPPSPRPGASKAAGFRSRAAGGDNAASAIGVGATEAGSGLRLARHLGRRSSPSPTATSACPSARFTPFATRCRTAGMAWR